MALWIRKKKWLKVLQGPYTGSRLVFMVWTFVLPLRPASSLIFMTVKSVCY